LLNERFAATGSRAISTVPWLVVLLMSASCRSAPAVPADMGSGPRITSTADSSRTISLAQVESALAAAHQGVTESALRAARDAWSLEASSAGIAQSTGDTAPLALFLLDSPPGPDLYDSLRPSGTYAVQGESSAYLAVQDASGGAWDFEPGMVFSQARLNGALVSLWIHFGRRKFDYRVASGASALGEAVVGRSGEAQACVFLGDMAARGQGGTRGWDLAVRGLVIPGEVYEGDRLRSVVRTLVSQHGE
jgi:hypothetical protein